VVSTGSCTRRDGTPTRATVPLPKARSPAGRIPTALSTGGFGSALKGMARTSASFSFASAVPYREVAAQDGRSESRVEICRPSE